MQPTEEKLTMIEHRLYNLTRLSFNITHPKLKLPLVNTITDEYLKAISYFCPDLTHADLSGCTKITRSGIIALVQNCTKLTSINLSGLNRLIDYTLTDILDTKERYATVPLEKIDITGCNFTSQRIDLFKRSSQQTCVVNNNLQESIEEDDDLR